MTQEDVVGLVIDALVEARVPYMVAGSFASNLHGVPRMTQDADIVVDLDETTATRLLTLLQPAFYVSDSAAREAIRTRRLFNVIHFDTAFKVDLVVRKHRPFSVEELRRRRHGPLAGRTVDFATPEDTILAKLEWAASGDSERQYRDAAGIVQVQQDRLDWDYLERWAAELGLTDFLARARRGDPFRSVSS
jgi:hypothetical protein